MKTFDPGIAGMALLSSIRRMIDTTRGKRTMMQQVLATARLQPGTFCGPHQYCRASKLRALTCSYQQWRAYVMIISNFRWV